VKKYDRKPCNAGIPDISCSNYETKKDFEKCSEYHEAFSEDNTANPPLPNPSSTGSGPVIS
jgi:hypothetical protein